jgi:hypothetical protein
MPSVIAASRPSLRPLAGARPNLRIEAVAERELCAWAMQHREQEEAGFAFEAIEAPRVEDDGLDHFDTADTFCLSFASPSIVERDPNAAIHDRYTGTVYDR